MTEEEIELCLKEAKADILGFRKGEMIFNQGDKPRYITMLVEGSVSVGNDSVNGKRSILGMFSNPGELFGEVFLFLNHDEYANYACASSPSKILEIPKEYLTRLGDKPSALQNKMLSNLLTIFAERTYYLNNRLQVLSCSTLKQGGVCRLFKCRKTFTLKRTYENAGRRIYKGRKKRSYSKKSGRT